MSHLHRGKIVRLAGAVMFDTHLSVHARNNEARRESCEF